MMRYYILILFVLSCSSAFGQVARLPEPVPSAATQMFAQLETGDWRNWIAKAEALDYLSRYDVPNAGPAVQNVLNDKHPNNRWLRGQALVALSRIDPDNAAALVKAHVQDPHTEVRVAVAQVCADLPKDQATPSLEKLLEDKTPAIQFAALAAYARHHGAQAWQRADAITAKTPDNAIEPAARALGWIGTEPALDRLRELMAGDKHQHEVLRGLKGVANPALTPIYLDLLASSTDSTLMADAWSALQGFQRDAVVVACRAALASDDERKMQAVSRLVASYLREPALGEALQAVLTETDDRATLLLGLSALSCVEADRFSEFFISQLSHDDPQVRTTAVNCLAQCQEVNLYETLENSLSDTNNEVRVAALTALNNADEAHVPQDRILEYFTESLLSPDKETRAATIATVTPLITLDNGEAALAIMQQMQSKYGTAGAEPLMHAVFRMVEPDQAALVLQAHGYVAQWHVIGAFPSGFGAPDEDIDGFTVAYPPEQEVDLTTRYNVKYNIKGDNRFGKEVNEVEIGWVAATVGNADGVLYMTKAGRSQLQMPRKNGVSYAYTELILPEKTQATMTFLLNMKAQDRVWLNGEVLALASEVDTKQGTATKTAAVTLNAGKNRLLVKVASNDHSPAWWAPKVSTRGFALKLADKDGKPVKWSHE